MQEIRTQHIISGALQDMKSQCPIRLKQNKQSAHVTHLSPMSSKLLFSTTIPRSENDLQKISKTVNHENSLKI